MRKIFTLLMVASLFSLVACGPSEEEAAAAEAEAEAMVNDMFEGLEEAVEEAAEEVAELKEHECDATCEESGCTGARCGEVGHECTDACHAEEGDHDHDHADGEEHDHSEE